VGRWMLFGPASGILPRAQHPGSQQRFAPNVFNWFKTENKFKYLLYFCVE
jgi:hypothetical protein